MYIFHLNKCLTCIINQVCIIFRCKDSPFKSLNMSDSNYQHKFLSYNLYLTSTCFHCICFLVWMDCKRHMSYLCMSKNYNQHLQSSKYLDRSFPNLKSKQRICYSCIFFQDTQSRLNIKNHCNNCLNQMSMLNIFAWCKCLKHNLNHMSMLNLHIITLDFI